MALRVQQNIKNPTLANPAKKGVRESPLAVFFSTMQARLILDTRLGA